MTKVDIADRVRIRAMKACTSGDMELFNLLVEVLNRFESTNRFYGTPLTALGLTVRIHNILGRDGVYSIEQLDELSDIDLLKMPNMGKKGMREIKEALQSWKDANQSEQEGPLV
jgi:DNA-directed RNA polymerase alpha subunit